MKNVENVWKRVLEIVKENTTPISYETWFKPVSIREIDDDLNIVYLVVTRDKGTDMAIQIIKDRYIPLLETAFNSVLDDQYRVVIKFIDDYEDIVEKTIEISTIDEEKEEPKKAPVKRGKEKLFNPKYTFDNFVVGGSNKYAHAVAVAVAETPGEAYNPVFIYGGSGLGKTHLMHAIGIHLLNNNPKLNVLYVSTEMFTNEVISAIKTQRTEELRNKYRKVDVLLVDDIQFLEGKESTQEEFFNTFNTLYSNSKQIIISSDRAPNKLTNLDRRLTSRVGSNMVADIQPPDYEMRVAILEKKAENLEVEVDEDVYQVICMIANNNAIKDNIRELEAAFSRVVSFSKMLGDKITLSYAKRVLSDIVGNITDDISPEKIKKVVSKYYGIKVDDLESSIKTNNIAYPRQIAMFLIRDMTDVSLERIGKYFGGKHHTTVKYAVEKIEYELKNDLYLSNTIDELKKKIKE